ncbi:hypothetical protein RND71_042019 [Anisodus tanguticus]|uniref:Uncharacterized protein n=1 Tax=Anisodus tanguticus TaxID=243964 RepID=A0AAE1QSY0_9SOLA|nr:hypothetical protein RND71_042019 [Anisodus tanguticus]
MPINSECTPPPPRIGKIGPYTVFMTPPATPNSGSAESPKKPVEKSCPVWSPPMQYDKPSHSSFGFLWNALAKLQNAHASLDEQVAYWFGLNRPKYQWALDDYYETKTIVKSLSRWLRPSHAVVQTVASRPML